MSHTEIDTENHVIITRMIRHYLSDPGQDLWTVEEDACVTARRIANRPGVMADARTARYLIEHTAGWSIAARAVWRNGKLMEPVGVHVAVEQYYDDNDALGGPDGARTAANSWLRSLPL